MAQYLILAHQTAASPELVERVRAVAISDPAAQFVLLVPATPVKHLFTWVDGESREVAKRWAEVARASLEEVGVKVVRTCVGDASPLEAVGDELREHPAYYDAVIICTFPLGVSRWLRLDLPRRVEHSFALPVIHVVAEPSIRVPARPSSLSTGGHSSRARKRASGADDRGEDSI